MILQIKIITNRETVIDMALSVVGWTIKAPVIANACYIWDGVFIGATATPPMQNIMLVSTCLFFMPEISTYFLDIHGLWLAMVLFLWTFEE